MKYKHDILSGNLRHEYAKTHFVSTSEMSFMRSNSIMEEGNVFALYKDGSIRKVTKGKNTSGMNRPKRIMRENYVQ